MKKDQPKAQIEYKKFPFEVKSFREDEEYFYFEGYLSTFWNEDKGGDVVCKGAFADSLSENPSPGLFWVHKSEEPLGVWDSIVEDEIGLYVKGRMPITDTFVKGRIIPQMKVGSIKSMSIGYSVWGNEGAEYKGNVRYLKKVFLWEGSLVTIPMNDRANIKELKSGMPFQESLPIASRNQPWDEILALGRIRDWAGAEDDGLMDPEVQEKYQKAFLWFDHEDPDLFGAYKLPIADVIEGELTVVPRAVFSAAAKLKGARGGIWFYFPEDRPRVLRTVEKYYEAMGLMSPFGKSFFVNDFKAIDVRDLEDLLQSGVKMSQKNAKMLISFMKAGFKAREEKSEIGRDDHSASLIKDWSGILQSLTDINNKL